MVSAHEEKQIVLTIKIPASILKLPEKKSLAQKKEVNRK